MGSWRPLVPALPGLVGRRPRRSGGLSRARRMHPPVCFRSKRHPPVGEKGSARAPRASPSLPQPSSSRVLGFTCAVLSRESSRHRHTCHAHMPGTCRHLVPGLGPGRPTAQAQAQRESEIAGRRHLHELQASHVRGKHVKWVRCSEARRTHKHVYPQCRPLERSPAAGPVSSWFIPVPSSSQHPSSLLADQRLRSVAIWPRSGSAPLVNIFEPTGHPLTPPGGLGINLSGLTQIRMNSGV